MKKFSLILTVAALLLGAAVADAGIKRDFLSLGPSDGVIDASAIDTSSVFTLPAGMVFTVDAVQEDSEPACWLVWSFTSASLDSFAVIVDWYGPGGNVVASTTIAAAAFTSGAINTNLAIAPGFPPYGVRVRMNNMDSAAAATTATFAYLVFLVDE